MSHNKTHGMSRTPIYQRWGTMMSRCYNPKFDKYKNYGARGIYVVKRWHDFKNWYEDFGQHSLPGLTMDRIDNNGPYSPANCRWANSYQQSRNTTKTKIITVNGISKIQADWAKINGICEATIIRRREKGWTEDKTVLPRYLTGKKNIKSRSSKFIGVSNQMSRHPTKPWLASIYFNKKTFRLGNFEKETDAAICYNRASFAAYGNKRFLNKLPESAHNNSPQLNAFILQIPKKC